MERNARPKHLKQNYIVFVSFKTAYIDLNPSPSNRGSISFRNAEYN
jgi:hypothetical protein